MTTVVEKRTASQMLKPLVGDGKELREEKILEKEPWEEGTKS